MVSESQPCIGKNREFFHTPFIVQLDDYIVVISPRYFAREKTIAVTLQGGWQFDDSKPIRADHECDRRADGQN